MRVPVVSMDGRPLIPTTPTKARKLLRDGVATGMFNKLGVFYIQMRTPVGNNAQEVKMTIDYGSKWDGYGVSGKKEACLLGMAQMPEQVAEKLENRKQLRRARRFRLWRRQARFDNRTRPLLWIAPSQNSKLEFRQKIVSELAKVFPIGEIGVEDVAFNHYTKRWGTHFSTAEIGKTAFYGFLRTIAPVVLFKGWQTARLRKQYGIPKCSDKSKLAPESHATDCVAMLAGMFGACPEYGECIFWYWQRQEVVRRSLHKQNHRAGGVRPRYGGTSNGTFLRKGDYAVGVKKDREYVGWVCGLPTDKTKAVGIADFHGKRIGQFSPNKTTLIRRATGVLWNYSIPLPPKEGSLLEVSI